MTTAQIKELDKWMSGFEIWRSGNLVYLETLKCASTYYFDIFENNGWVKHTADKIDWDNDHVFSFIMEPLERRLKGLTEYITFFPKYMPLLDLDQQFWSNLLYLNEHSMPYTLSFHRHAYQIDWIPIDREYSSDRLLEKLVEKYNITLSGLYSDKKNVSSAKKLAVYEKIKALTAGGNFNLFMGIDPDIFLYNTVCKQINVENLNTATWDEISWLRSK